MTPQEMRRDSLKKKILAMVGEAFDMMNGYPKDGGKIIVSIPKVIPTIKRKVKVTAFTESEEFLEII